MSATEKVDVGPGTGSRARRSPQVCLVGATDDTGNLGVSALMQSIVGGIAERAPDVGLTVFDNGPGSRRSQVPDAVGGSGFSYQRAGMWPSRRLWRRESLWNMRLSARLPRTGNPGVQAMRQSDAVWDISGGDSFGDLYGSARWKFITQPKRLALRQGCRLFLLPQTYGPFRTASHRQAAADVTRQATLVWARDPDSYEVLRDLLGDDFDAQRHRSGVDVAFGLTARSPRGLVGAAVREALLEGPTIGINVSGLLHNDQGAGSQYGLACDYRHAIALFLDHMLRQTAVRVVLVPHVRGWGAESDDRACRAIVQGLGPHHRRRVDVAPSGLDASETKWLIAQFEWFCGTRMHSAIAALSSGVPAAAVAYSQKTRGVFATCGMEDHVVDARTLPAEELVSALIDSYGRRDEAREVLQHHLPVVRRQAEEQFDELLRRSVGNAALAAPRGRSPR